MSQPTDPGLPDALATLGPAHDDQGASGHDQAQAAARRTQAVQLRLAGLTYEQVAERAGYADKSAARHAVLRALDRLEVESVQSLRELENARLDRAQAALWPLIIAAPDDITPDERISAVNSFLRLSTRRARMNGLDAPQQIAVTNVSRVQMETALSELREVVLGEVVEIQPERLEE